MGVDDSGDVADIGSGATQRPAAEYWGDEVAWVTRTTFLATRRLSLSGRVVVAYQRLAMNPAQHEHFHRVLLFQLTCPNWAHRNHIRAGSDQPRL